LFEQLPFGIAMPLLACVREMNHFSTDIPQLPGDSRIGSLRSRLGYVAIDEVFSGNALYFW